jgi:hypothetical protein
MESSDDYDVDMCINIDVSIDTDYTCYGASYVYDFDNICKHGIEQSWPMDKDGDHTWNESIFTVSLLEQKDVVFCHECFVLKVKDMFESLSDRERKMLFKRLKIWSQPDKFDIGSQVRNPEIQYRLDVGIAEIRGGFMWEWETYFRDCHAICCKYGLECIGCYFCHLIDSFDTKCALDD